MWLDFLKNLATNWNTSTSLQLYGEQLPRACIELGIDGGRRAWMGRESLSNSWWWSTLTDPGHRRGQNGTTRLWMEDKSVSLSKMELVICDGHKCQLINWLTIIFYTQGCPELHNNLCMPQWQSWESEISLPNWHKPVQGVTLRYSTTITGQAKELAWQGVYSSPEGTSAKA